MDLMGDPRGLLLARRLKAGGQGAQLLTAGLETILCFLSLRDVLSHSAHAANGSGFIPDGEAAIANPAHIPVLGNDPVFNFKLAPDMVFQRFDHTRTVLGMDDGFRAGRVEAFAGPSANPLIHGAHIE